MKEDLKINTKLDKDNEKSFPLTQLRAITTVHIVQVVTVFGQIFWIGCIKSQTITAGL